MSLANLETALGRAALTREKTRKLVSIRPVSLAASHAVYSPRSCFAISRVETSYLLTAVIRRVFLDRGSRWKVYRRFLAVLPASACPVRRQHPRPGDTVQGAHCRKAKESINLVLGQRKQLTDRLAVPLQLFGVSLSLRL